MSLPRACIAAALVIGFGCSGGQSARHDAGDAAQCTGRECEHHGDEDADTVHCVEEQFALETGLAANALILIDASSSMNYPYPLAAGNPTRWARAVDALVDLVNDLDEDVSFALQYFPTNQGCETAGVAVPFGAQAAQQIVSSLTSSGASGYTPTYGALRVAHDYLVTLDDPNPEYVILATDGIPNCGCVNGFGQYCSQDPVCASPCRTADAAPDPGDALLMVEALRMADIPTFVIGIAFEESEAMLEQMAMAGGMPRPSGNPSYYPAANGQQLANALRAVGNRIVSCNFAIDAPPNHADFTTVFVDGEALERDPTHNSGWDFVGERGSEVGIRLFGAACEALQSDGDHEVRAIYDCPPVD